MVGKTGVPPDSGVDVFRQLDALLVGAGFVASAVHVHEIGMGDEDVGCLGFTSVPIGTIFFAAHLFCGFMAPLNIDDVIMGFVKLSLGKIGKKAFVTAMAVDDDDLFAAVAGHFVCGFLKKEQLQFRAVGDGARFVLGFKNLSGEVFGEDHGVLLLGGVLGDIAHVEEVGADGKMRPVLFEDAEGKKACSLRFCDGFFE